MKDQLKYEMTPQEIYLALKPQSHSKELAAVKLLYMLFWNWSDSDKENLIKNAPNARIKSDIEYVFREKLYCITEKGFRDLGGISNALMSEFFLKLNQDSAEYVLEFACKKNSNKYL